MRKWIIVASLSFAAVAGLGTSWYLHRPKWTADSQALTPIVVDDARQYHYPLTFVDALKNDPNPGPKVFKEYCGYCHAPNPEIPLNAPILGHKADWVSRKQLGVDVLFKLSAEGFGAMPARGGCFECTDVILKKTIQYMLKQS